MISLILAAGIVAAGFAESRQGDRVLQEDFTQRLMHAEQSLDVADGELCIRIYHEIWKTGYHLTKEDKANIEQAFTICKGDYKKILEHAKRDRRYNEEEARARWQKILGYYTDLTRKTIRLSIAYMAIGEQDIQKFGNSQEKVDGSGPQLTGVPDILRDLVHSNNTASIGASLGVATRFLAQNGISRVSKTGCTLLGSRDKDGVKFKSGGTFSVKVGDDLKEIDYGITIRVKGGMVNDTMMSLDFDCNIKTIIPMDGDYSWRDDSSKQKIACPIGQTTLVCVSRGLSDEDVPSSAFPFFRSNPLQNWFLTDCGKAVSDRRLVIMICPEIVDDAQNVTPDSSKLFDICIPLPDPNVQDPSHECEACKKREGFWSWLDCFMF